MTFNLPERLRGGLYIFTGLGSLVVTYLGATGNLGADEMALWSGFTAYVAALAGFNLSPSPQDEQE